MQEVEVLSILFVIIVIIMSAGLVTGRSYFSDLKEEEHYCNGTVKYDNCGAGMFSKNACVKEPLKAPKYKSHLPIGYMRNIGHTGLGQMMCSSELQQKFERGDAYGNMDYGACVEGTNNVFDKEFLIY